MLPPWRFSGRDSWKLPPQTPTGAGELQGWGGTLCRAFSPLPTPPPQPSHWVHPPPASRGEVSLGLEDRAQAVGDRMAALGPPWGSPPQPTVVSSDEVVVSSACPGWFSGRHSAGCGCSWPVTPGAVAILLAPMTPAHTLESSRGPENSPQDPAPTPGENGGLTVARSPQGCEQAIPGWGQHTS